MVEILSDNKPGRRQLRDSPVRAAYDLVDAEAAADISRVRDDDEATRASKEALESVLRQGFRWLRFPKTIEAQFEAEAFAVRRRHLVRSAVADILAFNLAIPFSLWLLSDVRPLVWLFHGSMTLLSIIGNVLRSRARHPWQSNALSAFNSVAIAVGTILLMKQSHLLTGYTYSVAVYLFPVAVGITARLRFWYVVAAGVTTLAAYVGLMHGATPLQLLIVRDNVLIIAVAVVYTLVASYSFEYSERRSYLLRKIDEIQRESLRRAGERLRYLSMHDPLTGIHNRRQFEEDVAAAWSRAAAEGRAMALLLLDIDFFKLYNDGYGHPAGDACLRRVAATLAEVAAQVDGIPARLGGEEFGLLLPDRNEDQATASGERLCEAVRAATIPHRFSPVLPQVTVSVGVASVDARSSDYETLFRQADEGLYRAKTSGRNRVGRVEAVQAPATTAAAAAPAAQASAAVPVASPEEPDVEALLQAGGRLRRFPPALEAAFQAARWQSRGRRLLLTAVIGLVSFAALAILDMPLVPDVGALAWRLPLSVAGVLLVVQFGFHALRVRRWRELVTSVNTYIAGASTLFLLSCSNELTAHSHAVVAFLFPMYSGMAARQPIRYTLGVSLAMLVTLPLLMWGDQPVQKLLLLQNVYLMLVAIIFTLRCSVELERNERQGYLLDCHERQQREELTAAGERLRELSMRDPLTGLSNRRQFESDLQAVWAGAIDNDRAVSLLILDVDFFKLYNDGYGHAAGDTCLKSVAAVLARIALAEGGIAARLGGEEFAVLLPGKRLPLATAAAEKIVAAVRDADIPHRLSRAAPRVTVSVGAACIYPVTDQDNRYTLLRAADVALYRAKHAGRDRVAVVDGADAVAGAYDGAPGSAPGGADVAAALNRSA